MKTNIYLCVTEYHILLSILLAVEKYCSDDYSNIIIMCNTGRFSQKESYDLSRKGNIDFEIYEEDAFVSSSFTNRILNNCTGSLFVFNINNPHFLYLFYKLTKTNKADTAIVQEGLAAYNHLRFTFRESVSWLKNIFLILRKAGVKDLCFYAYCYGIKGRFGKIFCNYKSVVESSLVKSFWLTFPNDARYGKAKVKRLPDFTSMSINIANGFFKYQTSLNLSNNDIIFIDQGIEGSFEFISELSNNSPSSKIYIKLHPRTKQEWIAEYKRNNNVRMISDMNGIPIELLLQNLNNIIVISPFSSALLFNNPSCYYFYVYKWYIKHGYSCCNNNPIIPGSHIKVVEGVEDIAIH